MFRNAAAIAALALTPLAPSFAQRSGTLASGTASRAASDPFAPLYKDLEGDPNHDLKAVVILRDGRRVSEHYFNGDTASSLHDIRSATKSLTSLLTGMAIRQGFIHSVDEPIVHYLPGLPHDGKQAITIKDLLTMRSGLDADDEDPASPGNEDRLDASTNWIASAYAVPMKRAPGEKYLYCSLNAFLLGVIVENATHQPLDQFARTNLFAPLGITQFEWRHVPPNRTTGQGNLRITARDLAAIGQFVLQGGLRNGHKAFPAGWLDTSLSRQVPISDSDPYADFYGYMWYTKDEPAGARRIEVHFASGNGGNKIYIVPSLHMVVAITSSAYGHGYGQRRSQDILLKILAISQQK